MSLLPAVPDDGEPTQACIIEHCFHAFDALYCALTSAAPIEPTFIDDKYPLFVTWNIKSTRHGGGYQLRGCIGSFEPLALREGLADYALVSAFRDSRFRKIEQKELSRLECGISLLTDFEDAASYLDWTVGTHGIYITFAHPSLLAGSSTSSTPSPLSSSSSLPTTRLASKRQFSATYLPDVAFDQGWTKTEAIDSAIRKAGWDGKVTEDLRRSVKLRRYQSSKASATWEQYNAWRQARGEQ